MHIYELYMCMCMYLFSYIYIYIYICVYIYIRVQPHLGSRRCGAGSQGGPSLQPSRTPPAPPESTTPLRPRGISLGTWGRGIGMLLPNKQRQHFARPERCAALRIVLVTVPFCSPSRTDHPTSTERERSRHLGHGLVSEVFSSERFSQKIFSRANRPS